MTRHTQRQILALSRGATYEPGTSRVNQAIADRPHTSGLQMPRCAMRVKCSSLVRVVVRACVCIAHNRIRATTSAREIAVPNSSMFLFLNDLYHATTLVWSSFTAGGSAAKVSSRVRISSHVLITGKG